jgi:hypothetical protein
MSTSNIETLKICGYSLSALLEARRFLKTPELIALWDAKAETILVNK